MKIAGSVNELIGNTPLVRLSKISNGLESDVIAKLEFLNPGGGVKDRIGCSMIEEAEKQKLISPGTTVIIEPTSGNTGVGLAAVCALKGYKLILTMPENMSMERRKLLSAFGTDILLTPAGEGMSGAIREAERLHDEIKEANWLWGKNTIETTEMLLKKFGDREAHVACIGPAGEHLVYVAGICVDAGRYAAECGLGAVMGSKNLKAILVKGTNGIKIENIKEFKKYFGKTLALYESEPTTNLARNIGSNFLLKTHNNAGALVWRNLQYSGEELGEVTGQNINEKYVTKNRSGCYLCPLGCARHVKIDKGVYKGTVYNVPEYYTVDSLGPRLGIKDLENIFYNSELCDQLGLDSSSAPSIIGFVMECYQRGIITKENLDGLDLSWGNGETVTILLKKMAYREGFGNILADGIMGVIKKFGPESEKYAMHIKGLDIPCKDPRAGQTYGMRYAISTRGADHERCSGVSSKAGEIVVNIDDLPPKDSMKIFIRLEKYVTEVNLMNVCTWAWSSYSTSMDIIKKKEQYMLGIFNSATGLKLSQEDIDKAVERTILSERAENARYGMRRKDDYPPKRILEDPLPIVGSKNKGKTIPPCYNFDERLDYYYKYRGIDPNTVIPLESKLKELGMHNVTDELRRLKK